MKHSIEEEMAVHLTPAAKHDKEIWENIIEKMKGRQRISHIRAFIDRYGVPPNLSPNMVSYAADR